MRIRRRPFVTLVALAAAGAAIVCLWKYTSIVPGQVEKAITDNLLRQRGYRLQLDDVQLAPSGEVVFVNPRITTTRDTIRVLAQAEELRILLKRPWNAFRGRVDRLRLVRPEVMLDALQTDPAQKPRVAGPSAFPGITIDVVEIEEGRVWSDSETGPTLRVGDLGVRLSILAQRERLEVDLERATAHFPADTIRIRDLAGRFVLRADTLLVTELRGRTDASRIEGRGFLVPGERFAVLDGTASPIDLGELGRVAGLPVRAGVLQGPFRVRLHPNEIEVSGTLTGEMADYRLQDLEFELVAGPEKLVVRKATGRVNESPLDGVFESVAGGLEGRVDLRGVDLRRLFPTYELPEHELVGTLSFERAAPEDTLRVFVELGRSRILDVEIQRFSAELAHLAPVTRMFGASLETSHGTAFAEGELRKDEIGLDFEVHAVNASRLLEAMGLDDLQGDLRVVGRVEGPTKALQLRAEADFDTLRHEVATLWHGRIGIEGELTADPDLEIGLQSDSIRVLERTLRNVTAELAYRDRTIRILRSRAMAGDTLVAAVANVREEEHDWTGATRPCTRMQLVTALVRAGDQELRIEDPATIWWREGAVHVDSLWLVTRGGRLRLQGTLDHTVRQIDARVEMDGLDLEFARGFLHLEHEMEGTARGWLEVQGPFEAVELRGSLAAWDGRWNDATFDRLQTEIESNGSSTELRSLYLETPFGTLTGNLRLGMLLGFEDGTGSARFLERVSSASVSASVRTDSLDLARLWQARAPHAEAPSWAARLSSEVEIRGTVETPEIELRGDATGLRILQGAMGTLRFGARFAGQTLTLDDAEIVGKDQELRIVGSIPMRLHLARGAELLKDEPLDIQVSLPQSSFAIVGRFVPLFEPPPASLAPGKIEGQLAITGTPGSPHALGSLRIEQASFTLEGMEEIYRDVHAVAEFDGKTLRVTKLNGKTGEKGTIAGQGRVVFEDWLVRDYDLELQLDRVAAISIPEMSAVVSGNLTIRAADVGTPEPVPYIRGTLQVLDAEITQEFGAQSGDAGVFDTDVPEWLADLTLQAPKGKIWVKNSQADVELAGNIQVIRTRDGLDLKGQVQVERGTYSLYFERFEITRGHFDFSRYTGFDPEVDIEARRGRPGNRIYVFLTGRSSAPVLTFRSDRLGANSDAIQQELLLFGEGGVGEEGATALATVAERTLNDLAGLEYFSIDPAGLDSEVQQNPFLSYNVSAGRAVSDQIFLIYTQGVQSDIHQKVSLEIDINRWLLFESSYERRNITEATPDRAQNAFDINFKYRYEY